MGFQKEEDAADKDLISKLCLLKLKHPHNAKFLTVK